ncbi:MAG: 5'/3'-nucleotidase SurE [Myxococcales bacterium]|nr:5'/3'-nucleotidase SurE [Myxococcales bacterium]
MENARPLILVSNDDGYDSRGLAALRSALARFADVVVCAPARNQSATSHALTLHSVMRLERIDAGTYSLDGTPADCVYVALHSQGRVLPRRPDLVVSGVNHGPNLGIDVVYSGTVAAAREAAHRGIPAVAVSADVRAELGQAAELGARIAERILAALRSGTLAEGTLLNVNVPPACNGQLVATRLGQRRYRDEVVYRADPRGREYLWIGGSDVHHGLTAGTDTAAWEAGFASVTPLALDLCGDPERQASLERLVAGVALA